MGEARGRSRPASAASGANARCRRALGLAFALFLVPGLAAAGEGDVTRARDAYDRGVKADARGDHVSAARAFAEADALAPSVASLEAALESTMRADDAALGAELLERAEARVTDAGLAKTLEAARKRFAGRTGRVRVDCGFARTCLVAVDGAARDATRAVHVVAGAHAVVVERDGARLERLVEVRAGEVVVVGPEDRPRPADASPPSPPPARASAPPSRAGLAPFWFFAGAGLSLALGGVAVASGFDASSRHDTFTRNGCGLGATGPVPGDCAARAQEGERAETRTWILASAAGGLAVASAVVGGFFVTWSGARTGLRASPLVAAGGGGAALDLAW